MRRLPALLPLVLTLSCAGDGGPDPDDPLPPPPEGDGFQISMTATVPAGTEVWICQISELPNDEFMSINRVESVQTAGVHHMDVMALTFADVDLAPGVYDCNDVYAEFPSLMDDGMILYAAQHAEQEILLPEGTVASLPGHLLVMQELHYVNASPSDVEAFSKINVYRYEGDVEETIWGGAVRDTDLTIPPGDHVEWTRCVMNQDVDILFLSSHTHQLAREVQISRFDGEAVGELLYTNDDWQTPQLMSFGTEPLHVAAGTGFEFRCDYRNDTGETVHWGFAAADEMCQIAYVFTPGEASRKCEVVASSSDPE